MNKPIKRLGLLALGETPRPGLAAVFRAVLGPGVEILERGALDGLEPGQRDSLLAGPGRAGEKPGKIQGWAGVFFGIPPTPPPRIIPTVNGIASAGRFRWPAGIQW